MENIADSQRMVETSSLQPIEEKVRIIIIGLCALASQVEEEEQKKFIAYLFGMSDYWSPLRNIMRTYKQISHAHLCQIEIDDWMPIGDEQIPRFKDKGVNQAISKAEKEIRQCHRRLAKILGIYRG